LPVGLVLTPNNDEYLRGQIGEDMFVRGHHLVLPDEPALVAALVGAAPIVSANEHQIQTGLAAAFAGPTINLRSGIFAKRRLRGAIAAAQWKILATIFVTGLIASLLLALVTWAKYDRAIAREDAAALSAIQKIVPAAANINEGQNSLNDALSRRGNGGSQVTALAASVYMVLQQVPAVTIRDMRFNGDGIIAFTLAAPNVDGINQALQIMQQQGYKVTATPRQDASGVALADINMGAM
jgi:general secretion pathway protein L